MGAALRLREDYSADDLRGFACKARDGAQARRLMALAAVADGKRRAEAAAIGLMDRQTLRDWVVRFNAEGAEGLIDKTSPGRPPIGLQCVCWPTRCCRCHASADELIFAAMMKSFSCRPLIL